MKKQIMNFVAAIGFLFVVSSVSAFAQVPVLKANVPFDFQVNGKAMTAGQYTISEPASPQGVLIIKGDHQSSAAIYQRADSEKATEASRLVFRRYGNKCFLAKIQVNASNTNIELPVSKAERNLIKELGGRNLANNKVEPEIVTVALGQ